MDFPTLVAQAEAAPWTAVYGAVVSTIALLVAGGSLAWQVHQWRQRGEARADVSWCLGVVGPAPEHGLPEPAPVLSITVVNRDDVPVNVSMLGLVVQDGSGDQWVKFRPAPWDTLPGRVAARDTGTQFITVADLEKDGFDLDKPIVAFASLSTGRIESAPLLRGARVRRVLSTRE